MPAFDLSPALLALLAVLAGLPGWLLCLFLHRRHQQLRVHLEDELNLRNDVVHDLQLSETQLQTRLQALGEALSQALHEVAERKQLNDKLRSRLEQFVNQHHQVRALLQGQQSENKGLRERLGELRDRLDDSEVRFSALQQDYQQQLAAHSALQTELEQRERHFKEQFTQLADNRAALSREFENLAHRIFEEQGRHFADNSQHSLDRLLQPLRQQLDGFQQRVNEVHDAALQGNSTLSAEIRKVLEVGLQMSAEANNLSTALKGDSQQRGAWGEAQLQRTLEMSGLVEDAHFAVQSSFRNADGEQRITDYLIRLPDDKHIIIDSKVSLVAYDRAIAAETPEARRLALEAHVRAVRQHIDELAGKDYTNLIGIDSPSFVLMFMPIEPAYIEALKHNKELFDYGYRKGVVLVSHTTLIPILRTVANLWMIDRSNKEAREISARAGELYNQVCIIAERLGRLGSSLGTASKHYNDTVRALSGKQGLYGKIERFDQLSTKVSKQLPPLEDSQLDFEHERLQLILEQAPTTPPAPSAPAPQD